MANFYGTSRTNYFKVKDIEAFKAYVDSLPEVTMHGNDEGVCLLAETEDGYFPSHVYDDIEDGEDEDAGMDNEGRDIDVVSDVSKHLQDGEVAVFMGSGAEKLRYLDGWAVAIDNKGETVSISLYDIYEMAEKKFGVKPTFCEF